MDYTKRIEVLKEVLEDLKDELSEFASYDEMSYRKQEYTLLIALETYLENT